MIAVRGSARVSSFGTMVQKDAKTQPDAQVTSEDASQPTKLARLLTKVLADVASLKRRWAPRHTDYEDIAVAGTPSAPASVVLTHGFNGRVRYWVVDCSVAAGYVTAPGAYSAAAVVIPILAKSALTDSTTLVLTSYFSGTLTIRVEEAGA